MNGRLGDYGGQFVPATLIPALAEPEDAFNAVRVRAATSKPVCVGFGIANAESVRRVAQIVDSVIVGSALVAQIDDAANAVDAAKNFGAELRTALDR